MSPQIRAEGSDLFWQWGCLAYSNAVTCRRTKDVSHSHSEKYDI